MRHDLRDIAHRLGGEVSGDGIIAPGPGHTPLDRSMRVFIDPQVPSNFRVTSFAGDDWKACREHVCRQLGIEQWRPDALKSAVKLAHPARRQSEANEDRSRKARSIWVHRA